VFGCLSLSSSGYVCVWMCCRGLIDGFSLLLQQKTFAVQTLTY